VTVKEAVGADPIRSAHGWGAEVFEEVLSLGRGPQVVPQQCWADDVTFVVAADHAVLLSAHPHRGGPFEQTVTGTLQGLPPSVGIDLGAAGVGGRALIDDGSVARADKENLDRLS
jgi:hypothetical protein